MWLIKNQFIVIRAATKLKNLFRIMNALQSSEFQVKMKSMWLFENVIELFNIWIKSMLFVDCEKERKIAFDFNSFCFLCILNSFGLGVLQKMLYVVLLILNDLYLHEKKTGNAAYILFVYIIWCDGQSLNRFAMYASFKVKKTSKFRDVWVFKRIFVEWLLLV